MLQVTEGNMTHNTDSFSFEVLRNEEREYDYSYNYSIKIELCKSGITKWSKAQHYFSNFPIYSVDEEIIINKFIKPGLEMGVRNFNRGYVSDRKLRLINISRDKIAVQFLLSCSSEQCIDAMAYKLFLLSIRLFNLRQFNKLSYSNEGSKFIKDFKVQINQIPKAVFNVSSEV